MTSNTYSSKKLILSSLNAELYEHELDKRALSTLKNTLGLDTVIKAFNKYGLEKFITLEYMGSCIKVTENNFKEVYDLYMYACKILDISKIPDLYMCSGRIKSFTVGIENPLIVITNGCLSSLTEDELLFTLGHELGHIKSNHLLYQNLVEALPVMGELLSTITLGLGNILSKSLELALFSWQRKSDFTADRAGLLCCQNLNTAITTFMKMAGAPPKYYDKLNIDDFIKQVHEFDSIDIDNMDKFVKFLSSLYNEQPWVIIRTSQLLQWDNIGEYKNVLDKYTKSLNIPK